VAESLRPGSRIDFTSIYPEHKRESTMQMTGQRVLPVPPQQAWNALNDPEMLKACIPGCESIVETEADHFDVLMAARIGPVAAKFKGKLTRSDVMEPHSYKIAFDGQGGVAGFGKGSATVTLTPVEGGTQLDYDVSAQVGGKIAQIGSRLVDAAAAKIADEFFGAFESKLTEQAASAAAAATAAALAAAAQTAAAEPTAAPGPAPAQAAPSAATQPSMPGTASPASGASATPASSAPSASAPAPTPRPAPESDRQRWLRWAIAFVIAAAIIAYMSR
jgi:carbon monoxide dehydrogenase subunit G